MGSGPIERLVDAVEDYGIFSVDANGRVVTWNTGAAKIYGYAASDVVGRDIAIGGPELDAVRATGRGAFESWHTRPDGMRVRLGVTVSPIGEDGFAVVVRELSQDGARAVEERFRRLIESVKDYAIFLLDTTGHVATWNTGAERIKGYTASEIIGSHFSRFYPAEDVRDGKCEMELEVAASVGRFEDEGWRVRKDGTTFWANVVISAMRDDDGKLVGFSKITRDLTERRRHEEDRAARLAAERSNRTKDEFLAMLGHELRNPLAPIVTALQLLKLRGDGTTAREHQIIERQVAQMTRLVDDLLDVSRISRNKLELKRELVDVRDAIAKAVEIASPTIEKKAQHLEVTAPSRQLVANADQARLVQVFANLLNNAAKYTERGGHVWITVRLVDRDIVVEVRDDGVGIDGDLLPHVFDLFVQGAQDVDRAEGGLGLGLTLVKRIVELHGGDVTARSGGRGSGSAFVVRLPAARGGLPAETTSPSREACHGRRVLVVDDNDDARTLLAELLLALGNAVRTAANGTEALATLQQFQPDVAILDIGLPDMDGYELCAHMRRTRGHQIRIVALSGYGQPNDLARSRAAGFDAHLVKPVDSKRLVEAFVD